MHVACKSVQVLEGAPHVSRNKFLDSMDKVSFSTLMLQDCWHEGDSEKCPKEECLLFRLLAADNQTLIWTKRKPLRYFAIEGAPNYDPFVTGCHRDQQRLDFLKKELGADHFSNCVMALEELKACSVSVVSPTNCNRSTAAAPDTAVTHLEECVSPKRNDASMGTEDDEGTSVGGDTTPCNRQPPASFPLGFSVSAD